MIHSTASQTLLIDLRCLIDICQKQATTFGDVKDTVLLDEAAKTLGVLEQKFEVFLYPNWPPPAQGKNHSAVGNQGPVLLPPKVSAVTVPVARAASQELSSMSTRPSKLRRRRSPSTERALPTGWPLTRICSDSRG